MRLLSLSLCRVHLRQEAVPVRHALKTLALARMHTIHLARRG